MIKINKLNSGKTTITLGTSGGSSTSNYTWKDAEYPMVQKWYLSDGSAPLSLYWEQVTEDVGFWTLNNVLNPIDDTQSKYDTVLHFDGGLTAYRKYTPGHWEDASGNWVQGNWSDWSDNRGFDVTYDSNSGWGWQLYTSSETDPNANVLQFLKEDMFNPGEYNKVVMVRTWNNTVPNPNEIIESHDA